MSADNAIYIRQMPNGQYAVQDDSFSSLGGGDTLTDGQIDSCFAGAALYNTHDEACQAAIRMEEDTYIVEYGIIELPRKEPVEGFRGKYTVTVARTSYSTYTFENVTPEEAEEKAREAEMAKPSHWNQLSVRGVATAE